MGLTEQQVSFKFVGGVETKMDSKAVPAIRLLGLENGVFHRASSIKKRNGYELLAKAVDGSASVYSGAKRLATRDNELLLFTDNRCYSRQSADVDQWIDAGALIAPTGYDRPAVHTGTAQTTPDHATNGGVTAYAWEDSLGGVYWTTVDATSGRVYRAPTLANASGQRPRCVPVGDVIHIYYAVPTQFQICVIIVNPTTPSAAVSELIIIEDLNATNPAYDACSTPRDGSPAVIAWTENAPSSIRVAYVTAGGVLGSPSSGYPSATRFLDAGFIGTTSPIGLAFSYVDGTDNDRIGVAFFDNGGGGGMIQRLSGGTATVPIGGTTGSGTPLYTGAVSITRCTITAVGTTFWCVYEESAAQSSQRYCVAVDITTAGIGTTRTIRSLGLASRAFAVGDTDTYAVFVHDTTYFNTYMTLRLSDFAPAGRHLPGSAHGAPRSHVPTVYVDANSVATCALMYKSRLESADNDKFTETAIRRVVMDFDTEDSHQAVQFGAGLYLAAACPQHYDGYKWTEQGFNVGPEYVPYVVAAGGSMTVVSTYEYKVWYEWTDKQGEIHRGPESVGISVATGGADTQVTLALPMLRVTRKDNVRVCVARSLPGDTSRLWRVTSLDPTTLAAANGYVANDTTIDSVSFVDRMSDVNLQLQEQIYTVGGILSNDPAPLGSNVAVGRNRLFFTDAQDGSIVRFSQQRAFGFGLEVAPELQLDIDPRGGDITALHEMDDVVYAFKAGSIFAFNGDGPYADGGNTNGGLVGGFSPAQLITTDVGCTDPSSIVLTPQGLMFKSAKGIMLISRSREVTYVGSPVEAYNNQNVRRATVMPDRTAVLFLTDSGSSLYFDYLFQQWSTFTNHEGYDAAVVNGTYHYLRTNDTVFRETIGSYADGAARITLRLETAWLHLHEHLQGFQRFWNMLLLGTYQSPHQLAVQHRLNYDESWSAPYYLDATGDTDTAGWILDTTPATGSIILAADGRTAVTLESKRIGTSGNVTVVQIVKDVGPPVLLVDTPTLVQVREHNDAWSDIVAALNTSAYVTVASTPVFDPAYPDTATDDDQQSITLTGGADDEIFGSDPILGTAYGDGDFGEGDFGGTGPDTYWWRYGIHEQGSSVQFRFEDFEKAGLAGASFELTEMTIVGGIDKPDMRPFAGSRST